MRGFDRYHVEDVCCRLDGRQLDITNLSVSGMFCACTDALPALGSAITFDLLLPKRAPVTMHGQVVWCNEPEQPRVAALPSGFGIKIVRASFEERMAVIGYLRHTDPSALRRAATGH